MKTTHVLLTAVTLLFIVLTATAQDATEIQSASKNKDIVPYGKKLPPPSDLNKYPNASMSLPQIHRPDLQLIRQDLNKYKQQLLKKKNEQMSRFKTNPVNTKVVAAASQNADFHLVKDINALSESYPRNFTNNAYDLNYYPLNDSIPYAVINNVAYFIADDDQHGSELWRSDGTGAGTYMVKELEPGTASPYLFNIAALNGKIYFNAYSSNGSGVWVTDGTESGTQLLTDLTTATDFFGDGNKSYFIGNGNLSYFGAIWETDGTATGTKPVVDIGAIGSGGEQISQPTMVGDLLFFTVFDYETFGFELWRSDITEEGTFRVSAFYNDFVNFNIPVQLTGYNNKLYFSVNDEAGRKLWVSDGTTEGTKPAPGNHNVLVSADRLGTHSPVLNNVLYVPGEKGVQGSGLYKYDATNKEGLVKVKDIVPDGNPAFIVPSAMVVANNTLYFKVTNNTESEQDELWSSQGTTASTQLVTTSAPGGKIDNLHNDGSGIFYFTKHMKALGTELWRTVETPLGTQPIIVSDIFKEFGSSSPSYLTAFNGKLLFAAADEQKGMELFTTGGNLFSTALVKDIKQEATGSSYAGFNFFNFYGYKGMVALDNEVVFNAYERAHGFGLWKSDGTAKGTMFLDPIAPDGTGAQIRQFVSKNNAVYFNAYSDNTFAVYKTEGAKNSVTKLTPDYSNIQTINVADNGLVYYVLYNDAAFTYEIWRTDGTAAGTFLLHTQVKAATFNIIGNVAVFDAGDEVHGYELWRSDGTKGGTVMVKDINNGVDGSDPGGFYLYNGEVYFGAFDGINHAFWKSDGTKQGTRMVKNIDPWWNDRSPAINTRFYAISNGILYFSAINYADGKGTQLWKTDGTTAGTKVIKDINPLDSSTTSNPFYLTDVNGTVFFAATDGVNGRELWKTDGTTSGTQLVEDINPGSSGSLMSSLTAFAGKLYFMNVNFTDFRNYLWVSDGTAEGTHAVEDPGIVNVGVGDMLPVGNKLFLYGYTLEYGGELYVGKPEGESARFIASKSAKSVKPESTFNVLLSPNPVSSIARLQISGSVKNVAVSITDLNGRKLWQSSNINSMLINLPTEKFAAGTYFVTVTNGKESKTIKLVKQ
jgi:ELWxxDGT repeat protein